MYVSASLPAGGGSLGPFDSGSTQTIPVELVDLGNAGGPLSGTVTLEWWDGHVPLGGAVPNGGKVLGTTNTWQQETGAYLGVYAYGSITATLNYSDAVASGASVASDTAELIAIYTPAGDFVNGGRGYVSVLFNATSNSNHLAFIQNPSNTAAGDKITPPVTVAVEDASGNIQTGSSDTVTLALASSNSTLAGTVTTAAVAGIATFSNLSIKDAGRYTLRATDTSTTSTNSATSSSFNITGGKLVFQTAPSPTQTAGDPLAPAVIVKLVNSKNQLITSEDGTTVTLSPIGFTADNPITGNTAALSGGMATFSDVVLAKAGFYQLQATDGGDAEATTAKFKVDGGKLKFLLQPKNADINQPLAIKVEAINAKGQVDTQSTDSVQLSLNILTGGTNAALAGSLIGPLIAGVANFPATANLSINSAGTYTLTATPEMQDDTGAMLADNAVASATSNSFKVTPSQLVITTPPAKTVDQNVPIAFKLAIENASHQVNTSDSTDTVQVTLNTISGGTGANLTGTTSTLVSAGRAAFTTSAGPSITAPGVYTFTLSVPGSTTISSVTTNPFTVKGLHLSIAKLAHTVDIQTPVAFTVSLLDSQNKVVKTENTATVAIGFNVLSSKATSPTLTGTITAGFSQGVATFTSSAGPMFSDPGIYQLTATETGVATGGASVSSTAPALSSQISATRFHLQLLTKPANTNVNDSFPLSAAVEASNGTIRFSENTDVLQLSLNTVAGGENAKLNGVTSIQLKGGSADFTNSINAAGTYTLTFTEIDPATGAPSDATVPLTSKPFKVQGLHLAVLDQATTVLPYQPLGLSFAIENDQNKTDTSAGSYSLTETLLPIHGSAGATLVSGYNNGISFSFTGGVADLSNLPTSLSTNPGSYELEVTVDPADPSASQVASVKTKPITVSPLHMVVQASAASSTVYQSLQTKIALEDPNGKVDTYDSMDTATVSLNGTGGQLLAGYGTEPASSVQSYFNAGIMNLANNTSPTGNSQSLGVTGTGNYTLSITPAAPAGLGAPDLSAITTGSFSITTLQFAITQQPGNVSAGSPVILNVQTEDPTGKAVSQFCTNLFLQIQLSALSGGSGAVITPATYSINNATGQVFNEGGASNQPVINVPGTYQLAMALVSQSQFISQTITTSAFTVT